jgi:hypothetical protein
MVQLRLYRPTFFGGKGNKQMKSNKETLSILEVGLYLILLPSIAISALIVSFFMMLHIFIDSVMM